MNFDKAESLFKNDQIGELAKSDEGLRFLKLRSLSRKENLAKLFAAGSITPQSRSSKTWLKEAYTATALDDAVITKTINEIYKKERAGRRKDESEMVNQLYRLEAFDWGGLHQNSLEKTIVDNYIKKIRNYDDLSDSIENEIHSSLRGYVLCSWYNHWTSILIEDIFRDHHSVLPAVGLVKKIDFFINDVPFDLKVTNFPEGYIKDCRKDKGLRPESTLLKQWARKNDVAFTKQLPEGRLIPDLWKKASDHPSDSGKKLLKDLGSFRQILIHESQAEPSDLIKWLYEEQGVRRFDASNRLFLILVDAANVFESWKLKRAKPLLDSEITRYLDNISSSPGKSIEFTWKETGAKFSVVSDAKIITKPAPKEA